MSSDVALPRTLATAIIAALLGCAAAAWLVSAGQAASMAGMGGMAMVGAGLFLVTWVAMMVAMMFPAVVPVVLTHAGVVRSRGEGTVPTVAFVVGYLVVWMVAGLVPLGAIHLLGSSIATPVSGWLLRLGGAVVVLAGAYQLTPLKSACLRACRSPLSFMGTHDLGGGSSAAARAGISYGVNCVGSCWALMAVLAVLGLMNLVLDGGIFRGVLPGEDMAPRRHALPNRGRRVRDFGLAVTIRPDVLHLLGGPMAG
jgi:predicted metal-binding membrane protein